MSASYFFYDLETSGLNPRQDRIMQFAGQRTTLDFKPIGEPVNLLVRLSDDTLPNPDAVLVTGITPQQTVEAGYSEAAFASILRDEVFTEDTITVGFNNIRFDDEFIRALFWRTFNDPYEWAWRDGRSRWDMLDVVRMTRALRPAGIKWPVVDGKEVNRLENLAEINGILHTKAHDALSDVEALIGLTKQIQAAQPQLFKHLAAYRDKKKIAELVNVDTKVPFVYVSGRYESKYHKATVAFPLTIGKNNTVVVYDLRYDPTLFIALNLTQLSELFYANREVRQAEGFMPLPIKELHYNRAPAVAPLGVLEREDGWSRLSLTRADITKNRAILLSAPGFAESVRTLFENRAEFPADLDPEGQLYQSFVPDADKQRIVTVRSADAETLADLHPTFIDERLDALLLHYKARNFPASLAEDETTQWETWRTQHLQAQLPGFSKRLQELVRIHQSDDKKLFILQELQLWAESVVPFGDE